MELKVIEQKENPLLERFELKFIVSHAGEKPPKRDAVRDLIANHMSAKKGLVVLDHMTSVFGAEELKGAARVYRNAERAQEVERDHILKRNGLLKEKKEGK